MMQLAPPWKVFPTPWGEGRGINTGLGVSQKYSRRDSVGCYESYDLSSPGLYTVTE